ncbi:MAG: hypothetical protein Q8P89_00245 [bacterium]|nr:hypothetical protein [bacterium]
MQTLLICGGTKEERLIRSQELTRDLSKEDITFLESETALGIEAVREMEHFLSFKPYSSPFKACIIPKSESLTLPAQNALLKTLEEPPLKTLIILICPTPEILLPTIVSRCRLIQLPAKTEIKLTQEELQNLLSSVSSFPSFGIGERLKSAAKVAKTRDEAIDFLNKQLFVWHEILLEKLKIRTGRFNNFSAESPKADLTIPQLVTILKSLQKTKGIIEGNINTRLALENFFLDLPHIDS